jgi:hypothetical protein
MATQEVTEQLSLVMDEISRLRERFSQRPLPEKRRLGQLEKLLPKLRRLEKGAALSQPGHKGEALTPISADEQKLIAELTPKKK